MPAKIITLSQKDQDLLRVALLRAVDPVWREAAPELTARIKDLKERLV